MNQNSSLAPISVGVDEAARLIGVARSMFYEMIANDEIQTFKLGRRRLVRVKTLEAFIKRQAQENSR
ncbi:helix-turn-helix domain-containing protein [Pseudomonas protegens]|jgi:excisionase family DNA binding protein|uniref:helix-turn-helix domain-containing protein n=1 Tax=Pseudomonas protegens TaxID=380021 RepID=UPI0022644762|nr:helix-turn-helix domain-containing protein [Pseudomonas protegens]